MSHSNVEVIIDIKKNDNFSEFGIYKKKITSILSHESSKNKKILIIFN